jgi:hypothetical protein
MELALRLNLQTRMSLHALPVPNDPIKVAIAFTRARAVSRIF